MTKKIILPIAGAIIILGGSTYLMYRKNKNETNTDIDFEI